MRFFKEFSELYPAKIPIYTIRNRCKYSVFDVPRLRLPNLPSIRYLPAIRNSAARAADTGPDCSNMRTLSLEEMDLSSYIMNTYCE